jgi:hypothetical protein
MRCNRRLSILPRLFRCSNAEGLWCVLSLKCLSCRFHIPVSRQNFRSHRRYFLTCRPPSVSLLLIEEKKAGSNFHRRVAVVCRFVPTSR